MLVGIQVAQAEEEGKGDQQDSGKSEPAPEVRIWDQLKSTITLISVACSGVNIATSARLCSSVGLN